MIGGGASVAQITRDQCGDLAPNRQRSGLPLQGKADEMRVRPDA